MLSATLRTTVRFAQVPQLAPRLALSLARANSTIPPPPPPELPVTETENITKVRKAHAPRYPPGSAKDTPREPRTPRTPRESRTPRPARGTPGSKTTGRNGTSASDETTPKRMLRRKSPVQSFPPKASKFSHNQREKAVASRAPIHLQTLADLSVAELESLTTQAMLFKYVSKNSSVRALEATLTRQTIALIFNKRSTRTRVASETAVNLLNGNAMFLGAQDIQLGVNETLADSAKVISSMTDGIMARVGAHEEIEELVKHSKVPVINALSDLYHPTQILADILTLHEHYEPKFTSTLDGISEAESARPMWTLMKMIKEKKYSPLESLKGKKVAWIGDTNNISNELLVTLPRLGMDFAIASPKGYDKVDPRVWARVEEAGTTDKVHLTNSPAEALKDADVVVTDTWISMGQEEEKAARMAAFEGYQITNEMVNSAGAKPDWVFMHCLPRKPEEVDDEVFYGERSLVFPEAENRKWTIMAVFDAFIGRRSIGQPQSE